MNKRVIFTDLEDGKVEVSYFDKNDFKWYSVTALNIVAALQYVATVYGHVYVDQVSKEVVYGDAV